MQSRRSLLVGRVLAGLGACLAVVAAAIAPPAITPPAAATSIPTTLPPPEGCKADPTTYHGLTPNQLRSLYGLDVVQELGGDGSGRSIALLQVGGAVYDPATVTEWFECFGLDPSVVHQVVIGTGLLSTSGEATLDVHMAGLGAPGVDRISVVTVTAEATYPYAAAIDAALDPTNTGGVPVDVISMSYGKCAGDVAPDELAAVEEALGRARAAGVEVFFAAGDSGSGCGRHPILKSEAEQAVYQGVSYPASSPQAIAVGGTMLDGAFAPSGAFAVAEEVVWYEPKTSSGKVPECKVSDPCAYGGGGGASATFAAPPWQVAAGLAPEARHVPDIAMMAGAPKYATSGGIGTSFASPLFASSWLSVLTAIDVHGALPPGPLAPLLYELAGGEPGVVRDIVTGSNDPFGVIGCCDAGPGYDEASGLGSVDLGRLAEVLVQRMPPTTTVPAAPAPPAAAVAPAFTG